MTPPAPLDPSQIDKFSSLQSYVQECAAQTAREGKPAEAFEPSQTLVHNRYEDDGKFEIVAANPEKDFYCAAQVNSHHHEMAVVSSNPTEKKNRLINVIWMKDACSLTRSLVGEGELGGMECRDDMVDPRIPAITQMESAKIFFKSCDELFQKYGEGYGRNLAGQVRPERVFLHNPTKNDGEFSLMFDSPGYQFTCEGQISTLDHQKTMRVFAGNRKKPESMIVGEVEIHDACAFTRKALGEGELFGECQEWTKREEDIETGLGYAWHALWIGLGVRDIYKWYRGGWRQTLAGKTLLAIRHPIRTLSNAFAQSRALLASGAAAISNAFAQSKALLASGAAAIGRFATAARAWGGLRAAGWFGRAQLPSLFARLLGTVGATAGAGGELAAGGGALATAGVGLTVGAIVAGAAIGIGIGTLIEYIPRWLGAKKSVSDGMAWGIDSGVGVAAWGASLVMDKPAQDIKKKVTEFNINVLEHCGFGGWNVFKNRWDIA